MLKVVISTDVSALNLSHISLIVYKKLHINHPLFGFTRNRSLVRHG